MKGLGLLSETLLDALRENNDMVTSKIDTIRKKTRNRKREIAEERRSRALVGMTSFGPVAGAATSSSLSTFGNNVAAAPAGNDTSNDAGADAARGPGST
eukprot:4329830-Ditylum_brightwellii.AAC.1